MGKTALCARATVWFPGSLGRGMERVTTEFVPDVVTATPAARGAALGLVFLGSRLVGDFVPFYLI